MAPELVNVFDLIDGTKTLTATAKIDPGVFDKHYGGHISTEFTAWCARCSEWLQVSANSMSQARSEFRSFGWTRKRNEGWVCPDCAA